MQTKLFYEDEYEALNLMVSNSQKSAKELAAYQWRYRKRLPHGWRAYLTEKLADPNWPPKERQRERLAEPA